MPSRAPIRWSLWRVALASLLAIAAVSLAFLSLNVLTYQGREHPNERFDPVKWKSLARKKLDSTCYRGGMALNIIKSNILHPGMSRAEVELILGPPERNGDNFLAYNLGACSMIDYTSLVVHLDNEGKMNHVKIMQY